MAKLFDRVGQATATTGTGTLTLGSVITDATNGDLATFADMGAVAGDDVNYFIIDGNNFEIGHGVLGGTGPGFTLARTVAKSKISGTVGTTALTLTGSAKVFCDAFARMANTWANDIVTSGWVYVKDGAVGIAWGGGGQLLVGGSQVNINDAAGSFAINSDLFLARDAANTFAQKNSTNAQTFRVYGSDGGANYSRLSISHAGGTSGATIATEAGGTGTAGPLNFAGNGAATVPFSTFSFNSTTTFAFFDTQNSLSGLRQVVGGPMLFVNRWGTGTNWDSHIEISPAVGVGFDSAYGVRWSSASVAPNWVADTGINRNAAGIVEVNSGTAGTLAQLYAKTVRTQALTVATLPSASTASAGARAFVTDATAPTFGATVAGSGAVATPVYSDGTNWKVG